MKLIKQNDSAGGLIFKQNINGKAMKQNYSFGQTIILSSGLFLDFPSIVGVPFDDFSCVIYNKSASIASNYNGIINTEWDYDKVIQVRVVQINPGQIKLNTGNISNSPGRASFSCPANYADKLFIYFDLNAIRANSVANTSSTVPNFFPSICSGINVNKYLRDDSSAVYDSCVPLKISEIRIYSRRLQSHEFLYEYNNKLGNESLVTPKIWIKASYASIIDFGTIGNAVGIVDVSGNGHHARINGLPAGPLQDQLDYANANLFESW